MISAIPGTRWCAALLLLMGLTGCGSGNDVAPPPAKQTYTNWPEALSGLRFRWSAEPGIDLLTGAAVPLRAYLESHRTGDFTLNPATVYPGFHRAVPPGPPNDESFPEEPNELRWIQPFTDPRNFGPAGNFYGNEYFHVLEFTPVEEGWRAYVCDGTYNFFRDGSSAGTFEPVKSPTKDSPDADLDDTAVRVWRIEFTDQSNSHGSHEPPPMTAPQKGANPAPVGDVFGPWHFTGANDTPFWGPPGDGAGLPVTVRGGGHCRGRCESHRQIVHCLTSGVADGATVTPADPRLAVNSHDPARLRVTHPLRDQPSEPLPLFHQHHATASLPHSNHRNLRITSVLRRSLESADDDGCRRR